jgi:hypothetical protein
MFSLGKFMLFLITLIAWTMLVFALGGCTFSIVTPTLTPTATLTPTLAPTYTPTPSPTPTEIPVTQTEQLSPQELLERDFGSLVPKEEKCLKTPEVFLSMPDYFPSGVKKAELIVHSTGITDKITIPFGKDKAPREVTRLQVVCRDNQGTLQKPMWLILGGDTFGKYQNGENPFWHIYPDGVNGYESLTTDEVLGKMKATKGARLDVMIPADQGNGFLQDKFLEWDLQGPGYVNHFEIGNELANESVRQLALPENKTQIDLLLAGQSVSIDNFSLYPLMITYYAP